jgi:tetratricopeptide (TPR) repeat protein/transcriptional regulator with XRE-family HTH domain
MFGEQLRAYRQQRSMTQEELADATGVSVRNIRNLELGRSHPRPQTLRLLAEAFGLAGADRDRFCQDAFASAQQKHTGAAAADAAAGPPVGRPTPAQLPADVSWFVGRSDHLIQLSKLLDDDEKPAAVVISAIAGTAGVGKTALAVHWAHQALDRFPDGQLYVNLRGYDPDQPATPGDVLARLLTALGVPGPEIPVDLDERAARYRTELAGRRLLIVLDNAASADQIRPLLPGIGASMALVTSRDSLAGLVALHGAHRIDLDLLPPADAVALLRGLIGQRVDADPDAAAALAAQCAHLPLALRMAAELAVARPATPLSELVAELVDQHHRLAMLDADGDPRAAVGAVFSWSMRHLPVEAARTFRLLGLHPGPDIDAYAVAALTGLDLPRARQALDRLARAHLVHPTGHDRYGMHDLLRAYAAGLTTEEDTEADRRAASTRLFDYYVAAAAAAAQRLELFDPSAHSGFPVSVTPVPDLADSESARQWLDTERPCLIAAAGHTAVHGLAAHTVRLSTILYRYLDGGHFHDALTIHGHARDAAQQAGDPAGQAHALIGLGTISIHLQLLDSAAEHLSRARALFQQAGDQTGEARALNNLGIVEDDRGRYRQSADYYQQALAVHRQTGNRVGQARVLSNLGVLEKLLGQYRQAAEHTRQALELYRQTNDPASGRVGEAYALMNLGVLESRLGRYRPAADHLQQALELLRQSEYRVGEGTALVDLGLVEERLGHYGPAADHHEQALALFRELGYRRGEAMALDGIGRIHTRLGRPDQATAHHQQALTLCHDDRAGQTEALNGLGEAAHVAGRTDEALAHHTAALAIATDISEQEQQARADTGIGRAHHALGDPARARHHYERALTRYTDLGSPTDDARALLSTLNASPGPGGSQRD